MKHLERSGDQKKKDPLRGSFFFLTGPSVSGCPASHGKKGRLSYTLHVYIVYNINSTLLAQRGMARLRALVLPLGHHVQAQQGMQLHYARLGSYRMT